MDPVGRGDREELGGVDAGELYSRYIVWVKNLFWIKGEGVPAGVIQRSEPHKETRMKTCTD